MDRPFYSVTFGDKNSWDEWNLIPVKAGKIEFATPNVKYESEEIPGSDNVLDMSEVLTGYPLYDPRKGSVTFRFFDNGIPARTRFDRLKNYLHGRKMRAIIEDQPEYYYEGRFMVGDFQPKQGNWGDVDISYILNAYKLELNSTAEDWLWDPFNFETGIIREYWGVIINNHGTVTVIGSRKPTVPKFTVTGGGLNLTIGTSEYYLPVGKTIFPQLVLMDQEYEFVFDGHGTVTIEMTAGVL